MSETSVVLFVLTRGNNILVEKRRVKGYQNPQFLIPGGAINDSENLEQALKREMMEELGVIPIEFELLTDQDIIGVFGKKLKPFIIKKWEGTLPKKVLDTQDPLEWVEIDAQSPDFPGNRQLIRILKEYLQKRGIK